MKTLETLRKELDAVDQEMAYLFEQRLNIIEQVRLYKKANNLPVQDVKRESSMKKKNSSYIKNPSLEPYYIDFLTKYINICKGYMRTRNEEVENLDISIALLEEN